MSTTNSHPAHTPLRISEIVNGVMHCRSVIPQHDIAIPPAELVEALTEAIVRRAFEALSHNRERELDALAQRLLQPSLRLQ